MSGVAPAKQTEHALGRLKGWFHMHALDFTAKLAAAVSLIAYAGRVVHLNASGEFEMGIANTQMPIFLISGSNEFDVSNPGITAAGGFMHIAVAPAGNMTGLVATGGYELSSTEFDKTPARAYAPNQLLTSRAHNTDQATGGLLSNDRTATIGSSGGAVRQYVDPACGVVSRGNSINEHSVPVLSFWSVYMPAAFA